MIITRDRLGPCDPHGHGGLVNNFNEGVRKKRKQRTGFIKLRNAGQSWC